MSRSMSISDCGGDSIFEQPAPFITSLNDRPSIRLASLGDCFVLPSDVYERCSTPPPTAKIDMATSAASCSLYFSNEKQQRVWERYFHSDAMRSIVTDAFWWTLASYFSTERDDALLKAIEERIANQFATLISHIGNAHKDLIVDNMHDTVAQCTFYMIYAFQPQFRHRLDAQMCTNIAKEFARWFQGPMLPPIDIRHWRIVKVETPRKRSDSITECVNAIDNNELRPSEKLDIIYRNRDDYVSSVIPIRTVKSLETFSNSRMIAQYTRKPLAKPFKVRLTKASATHQPRNEAVFMRNLAIWREHEQNQKLRQKLDEIRASVAKEILDVENEKLQMRRSYRSAKIEARASTSEFVAGVVKQIQEEMGHSRPRSLSEAIRSEFGLGPAPSRDWC